MTYLVHMRFLVLAVLAVLAFSSATTPRPLEHQADFTVYIFMAQRCNICKYYTPALKQLHADFEGKGVHFEGVFPNAHSTPEEIAAFDQEFDIPFPLHPDTEDLTSKYGATVTPEVVLVDIKGVVRYQGRIDNSYVRVGKRRTRTTSSELKDALKAVTSGKPVNTPAAPAIGCIIERPKNP